MHAIACMHFDEDSTIALHAMGKENVNKTEAVELVKLGESD